MIQEFGEYFPVALPLTTKLDSIIKGKDKILKLIIKKKDNEDDELNGEFINLKSKEELIENNISTILSKNVKIMIL